MSSTEPPQWQPPQSPGGSPPPPPPPGGSYPPPPGGGYPPPPGGNYPPPGGNYPPPPGGSYPPPPGGNYPGQGGYPPPPGGAYPGSGGGYPPHGQLPGYGGGSGGYSIGDAFTYGWAKFVENVGPILGAALAYIVGIAVIYGVFFAIFGGLFRATTEARYDPTTGFTTYESSGGGFLALLLGMAVYALLLTVLAAVMQAGISRGVLTILSGRQLTIGTMFSFANVGAVIVAGLLIGLGVGIGTLLCFIPGLIVAFFSQFYVWFIVDKQMGAVDAIKASFSLVNNHLGTLIGFYFATILAVMAGALACGIGLIVAVPVVYIAQGYTYRKLLGEPIAP